MEDFSQLTKILSAEQIRSADQYTIENLPIESIDLMEKASRAFVSWFLKKYGVVKYVKVFCGTGNNGGDGLAIARLLLEHGCGVLTFCIGNISKASPDFKTNLERLKGISHVTSIASITDFPNIDSHDFVIDGIFGSGLTRPVEGLFGELIDHINISESRQVISIDIASGLFSDAHTSSGSIIECDQTISFQVPKLAFFYPQNSKHTGEVSVVDIGLDIEFIQAQTSSYHLVTPEFVKSIYQKRVKYAHKGSFGKNLIISGSKGKIGAAVLATKACLRAGAGLVTAYVPDCGYQIMQTSVPEAMVITDQTEEFISGIPSLEGFNTIGIGPGIGTKAEVAQALKALLSIWKKPLVLDADALNIISEHNLIDLIPKGSILTPHPGEFSRLAGNYDDDFERLVKQIELSKKYELVILLKGAHTSITDEDGNVYFNDTGNPGMATGGSGDVLTGIVTSLLGQGYSPDKAAILGAYIHGLAGNLFVKQNSEEGLIARDLVDYLPKAFDKITSHDSLSK